MLQDLNLRKAIEFAVKTEQIGARVYERLARQFADDAELKQLFEHLGQEEVGHERQFQALLDKVPETGGEDVSHEQQQYLRAMTVSEIFSGDEQGLIKNLDQVKTREDALERALNMEKATLGYYKAMQDILGSSEALDGVIAAEKRHVVHIAKYLLTGEEVKGV